jgi:hypothetical protein
MNAPRKVSTRMSPFRRVGVLALALTLAPLTVPARAGAAPGSPAHPRVQADPSVPGGPAAAVRLPQRRTGTPDAPAAPVWPSGSADVALSTERLPDGTAAARGFVAPKRARGLPVSVGSAAGAPGDPATDGHAEPAPSRVTVNVLDRKSTAAAGVDGLLLRIAPTGGPRSTAVRLEVDYTAFRDAYGGDWSTRLGLVQLSGCASPADACSVTPLRSRNDTAARTVAADVPLTAPATSPGRTRCGCRRR